MIKDSEIYQALEIASDMAVEVKRARDIYPKFNSTHEGYAILQEEVDELWDEIKQKKSDILKLRNEAIQVGAMAIRFIQDCCEENVS